MRTDDVRDLVLTAARGDGGAWTALVERFSGLVWSVARGQGLGRADAEEVCQITWLRFAEHIGQIKEPGHVAAWLATTARHESIKVARAGRRVDLIADHDDLAPAPDELSPEQVLLQWEEATAELERLHEIWAAFQELPGRCLQLLRALLATPSPSYAEVAAMFDMPIGSIGPTRARCLRRLRELLAERGITGRTAHS